MLSVMSGPPQKRLKQIPLNFQKKNEEKSVKHEGKSFYVLTEQNKRWLRKNTVRKINNLYLSVPKTVRLKVLN